MKISHESLSYQDRSFERKTTDKFIEFIFLDKINEF
jgi:hypothetical protein